MFNLQFQPLCQLFKIKRLKTSITVLLQFHVQYRPATCSYKSVTENTYKQDKIRNGAQKSNPVLLPM